MFHLSNGLFFARMHDGRVLITKTDGHGSGMPEAGAAPEGLASAPYGFDAKVAETFAVEPSAWASLVAAMSARGENGDTHAEALNFHQQPEVVR